jgi:hypothetical protein
LTRIALKRCRTPTAGRYASVLMPACYSRVNVIAIRCQYKGQYRYAKTEREAKKKLLVPIEADETRKPDSKTAVAAFMDRWLTFAEQNLKPATVKRYREAIEIHRKASLGDKKLHKLDALTVQAIYASDRTPFSVPVSMRVWVRILAPLSVLSDQQPAPRAFPAPQTLWASSSPAHHAACGGCNVRGSLRPKLAPL